MASTFPSNDLDRPEAFQAVLGSFWNEIGDDLELQGFLRGAAAAWRRAADRIDRAARAVAFDEIPLLDVVEWTPVAVLESTLKSSRAVAFGDSGVSYGGGWSFGSSVPTGFQVPIPGFDACAGICDSPAAATVFLVPGAGFSVGGGVAVLDENPFDSTSWSPQPVLDSAGLPIDRSLTLWLWRASRDDHLLQRRIGYVLGMDLPSTPAARATASAFVDCLVAGTSDLNFRRVLAAALDVPLCETDGETVVSIHRDPVGWVVATDSAVHRCPAGSAIVVSVGDVLAAGDPICDAVRFDRLGPDVPEGLEALALPPGYAPTCGRRGATFALAETPIRVTIPGIPL